MPARKLTIIAVTFLLPLLPNYVAAQEQPQQIEYPKISDLLSSDDLVRGLAITQLERAQEKLIGSLSRIIDVNSYMKFPREKRYNSCYLLRILRPTSEDAIKALISVVNNEEDFDYQYPGRGITDTPSHFAYPGNALRAIGYPASPYILDAIAQTDNKRSWRVLCSCLQLSDDPNEGFTIACYLVQRRIAKETDPTKRARLQSALNEYREKLRPSALEELGGQNLENLQPTVQGKSATKAEPQPTKAAQESSACLVPALTVAVVVLAGTVLFLLLRRRKAQ